MLTKELAAENKAREHTDLLSDTLRDVALGTCFWYLLVRLSALVGPPHWGEVSGWVGFCVMAVLLPASWFARRVQR